MSLNVLSGERCPDHAGTPDAAKTAARAAHSDPRYPKNVSNSSEDQSPKLDLTRLEDFPVSPMTAEEQAKEPAGPDFGTLLSAPLGTQDLPGLQQTSTSAPPPPPGPGPATPDTETLLKMLRESRTKPAAASPAPPAPPKPPPGALEEVRKFSEQISAAKELVPAAFPFSVMIDGMLAPEERERLVDLLNRENLEIREIDLEPQFAEGRILIPRVSEFVGILIVQALRSSGARIRIGPADQIFSTADTKTEMVEEIAAHFSPTPSASFEFNHSAERIPVTSDSKLPELGPYTVVDIVTASAALTIQAVEAARSTEYQEMIENLQRELRFKAWRKGATAILNYSVQLNLLSLPSRYRVVVTGSAVRAATSAHS
jgi:hypothetical protein